MSALVLTYHGIESRPGPLFVEPSLFAEQLDAIVDSGATVLTVSELAALVRAGRLPQRAVAITFDDGFQSVARHAAPALLERGLRATVYCVAGRLGRSNEWSTARPGAPIVDLVRSEDVATLARAEFEIGSHGWQHLPLETDNAALLERELVDSKAALEEIVERPVESFALPYGARPSEAARALLAQTYAATVTTSAELVTAQSDPHALPRVDASYLQSPERIASVLVADRSFYLSCRRALARARRVVRQDYVPVERREQRQMQARKELT